MGFIIQDYVNQFKNLDIAKKVEVGPEQKKYFKFEQPWSLIT